MAIALQDGVLVWQKVAKALASANPASAAAFRELKTYLMTQGGAPQLQFVPFTSEQIIASGGYSPDVDACTIYGVYGKGRRTSATTAAYFQLFDQTDNTASTTLITFVHRINLTGDQWAAVFPGAFYKHATELTIASDTTVAGDTESTAALSADGFVLIGAA